MDFSFYALLTVACLVLVLAMWACASAGTEKWGPDLTMELPPHLLQEALFGSKSSEKSQPPPLMPFKNPPIPSAPSERSYDPLLSNEHTIDISDPPVQGFRSNHKMDMSKAVQVLPSYVGAQKALRPVFSTFKMEQPI